MGGEGSFRGEVRRSERGCRFAAPGSRWPCNLAAETRDRARGLRSQIHIASVTIRGDCWDCAPDSVVIGEVEEQEKWTASDSSRQAVPAGRDVGWYGRQFFALLRRREGGGAVSLRRSRNVAVPGHSGSRVHRSRVALLCAWSAARAVLRLSYPRAYEPEKGLRFNPAKLLIDPYCESLTGRVDWNAPVFGYEWGIPTTIFAPDPQDTPRRFPKAVVSVRISIGAMTGRR